MSDPENRDGIGVLIDAPAPGTTVQVDVAMPSDVLNRIDAVASRRGQSRSGFLIQAAERAMDSA